MLSSRFTSIPHIAHLSEKDADNYLKDPLKFENFKNGEVIETKKFLNEHGFWQTNVKIKHD